jgi:Ca-activated chloride channel family protein
MNWKSTLVASLLGVAALPALAAEGAVVLVFDASGSMWARMEGRTKIEVAREAVDGALREWPAARPLGLVAYGHRSKSDCRDIERVVAVGAGAAASVRRAVGALKPNGMTPIGASLDAAVAAVPEGSGAATLVLVSDGEETCGVDPCAVAKSLRARRDGLVVHVVGFDVAGSPAAGQLACVARATGGRYFDARDPVGLQRALGAAVATVAGGVAPPAAATLRVDGPLPAASAADVQWTGPADPLDFLAFAAEGAAPEAYAGSAYTRESLQRGRAARVPTPAAPGRYELRYVSPTREPTVLAKLRVEVAQPEVTLEAAAEGPAAGKLAFVARGPAGDAHWIGIAARGDPVERYVSYVRPDPSGTTRATLDLPARPGDYELRYVLNERERIAASRPVRVVESGVRFGGLAPRYGLQEAVRIDYEGPRASGNWIGFVRRGQGPDAWGSFAYLPESGPVEFYSPYEAGDYDFVLVVQKDGVDTIVARTPVEVR